LWRWNRKTNREETLDLKLKNPQEQVLMIAASSDGRVFVPLETRIEVWQVDDTLVTHATLPDRIQSFSILPTR
jgi:hypothetical protein